MRKNQMKRFSLTAVALSAAILSACATQPTAATGEQSVSFPELSRTYLKTGHFVEPSALKQISTGLNRDQVRLLLGNPHFNEGLVPKSEWNYVFNLYTGNAREYITCQYQVHYGVPEQYPQPVSHSEAVATDKSVVLATYWDRQECKDLLNPPPKAEPVPVPPPPPPPPIVIRDITLDADALFPFARHGRNDLFPEGRSKLDALAQSLLSEVKDIRSIEVIGHTDRIGSDSANQLLSERRARTVADYLVDRGLSSSLITASGRGEKEPVSQCGTSERQTPALISCLQPDRRVVVTVRAQVTE